jgi:hypothetical protein
MEDNRLWDWTELKYDARADKGLVAVWAYRCFRCGYIWLPRDYDVSHSNTLAREPPKACARCKSKYWNRFRRDFEDNRLLSKTRDSAKSREFRRNQSPEEREKFDKIVKSAIRKVRRQERKERLTSNL